MSFFSSDIAIAIAWIFGIAGFIYALIQKQANNKLKIEITETKNQILNLKNIVDASETDKSQNNINQTGEKNNYTKHNSGGMTINM